MNEALMTFAQNLLTNSVFMTAVGGIVSLLIKRVFDLRKLKAEHKASQNVDDTPKLEYHHLFEGTLVRNINTATTGFILEDLGKTLVFRAILIAKFQIWYKHLLALAREVDECVNKCGGHLECNKLENINMKHFNAAMSEFSTFYLSSSYTADEIKCLEIVMRKFDLWHQKRVQKMIDRIREVCNDPYLSCNCAVAQAIIFDDYIGQFAETMTDATRTLGSMNGDLNGLMFKGVSIGSQQSVRPQTKPCESNC